MAADGPALLAAAVRAACLAKAPRRTIQAIAAAVAGVLVRPATNEATPRQTSSAQAGPKRSAADVVDGSSPEELLVALRAARSAQRRRKKERRCAAKRAAVVVAASLNVVSAGAETRVDMVGASALEAAVLALPLPEARLEHVALSMTDAVKRPSPDDSTMSPLPCRQRRASGRGKDADSPPDVAVAAKKKLRLLVTERVEMERNFLAQVALVEGGEAKVAELKAELAAE
jgi:hypothetical protein